MPIKLTLVGRQVAVEAYAVYVLETPVKANLWLERPNLALGGETPVSLLGTEEGCKQVVDVLNRILFGVNS